LTPAMCVTRTPLEDHRASFNMVVKREDLCCPPGPHFSKTRGVFAHIAKREEKIIGVLDTSHSQGGWAVAQACHLLGKQAVVYYPVFTKPRPLGNSQVQAQALGAMLVPLQAGMSAVLYHQAKRDLSHHNGYMMPNALKLEETVSETAAEFRRTWLEYRNLLDDVGSVLVSASSGTIAAGLWRGMEALSLPLVVHMGYSRPADAVHAYIVKMSGRPDPNHRIYLHDEKYSYKDTARAGGDPPFPCNEHYDLKTFRWWNKLDRSHYGIGPTLFWNIG
jgi:threonine dehydratase